MDFLAIFSWAFALHDLCKCAIPTRSQTLIDPGKNCCRCRLYSNRITSIVFSLFLVGQFRQALSIAMMSVRVYLIGRGAQYNLCVAALMTDFYLELVDA